MSDESNEDSPCVTAVCCLEGCRVFATFPNSGNLAAARRYRTRMSNKATTNKKNSVTVNFCPGGTLTTGGSGRRPGSGPTEGI
jgi:hypothetical protein